MFSSRKTAADFTFSIPCNRLCHLVTDNTTKTILNHRKFMSGVVDVLKWEEEEKKNLFQCAQKYYFTLNIIFII